MSHLCQELGEILQEQRTLRKDCMGVKTKTVTRTREWSPKKFELRLGPEDLFHYYSVISTPRPWDVEVLGSSIQGKQAMPEIHLNQTNQLNNNKENLDG